MDGVEHAGSLERLPPFFGLMPRAVEQDVMRVQLRIESPGGRVHKRRADQVLGEAILILNATHANPSGRKLFKFRKGDPGGFLMGLNDPFVFQGDRQNRNAFGWGALKIKEDPGGRASTHFSSGSQSLASRGVQVIAEPQESLPSNVLAGLQSQPFTTHANPLPGLVADRKVLGVIVVVREMLVKISRCRRPVLLRFTSKHKFIGLDGIIHRRPKVWHKNRRTLCLLDTKESERFAATGAGMNAVLRDGNMARKLVQLETQADRKGWEQTGVLKGVDGINAFKHFSMLWSKVTQHFLTRLNISRPRGGKCRSKAVSGGLGWKASQGNITYDTNPALAGQRDGALLERKRVRLPETALFPNLKRACSGRVPFHAPEPENLKRTYGR